MTETSSTSSISILRRSYTGLYDNVGQPAAKVVFFQITGADVERAVNGKIGGVPGCNLPADTLHNPVRHFVDQRRLRIS
jgi:hypothetical protein